MFRKATFFGTLAGLGFLLGAISGAIAAETLPDHSAAEHSMTEQSPPKKSQFQQIEQPLSNKLAVTATGLGLIGLELWWFLLSKPKSRKAEIADGIQEVTITVDGGYEPNQIVVQAGQPVKLNFLRKDPSSCLEKILIPDFRVAVDLPLDQMTAVEFTPEKPGDYSFTCGMNMFRGTIKVEDSFNPLPKDHPTMTNSQSSNHSEPISSSPSHFENNTQPEISRKASITVDKDYTPNYIIVEAGQPVQLSFLRRNPSPCVAEVLLPEFNIAADLPINEIVTVEFTPEAAGQYVFSCGMDMVRGVIQVEPSNPTEKRNTAKIAA